MDGVEAHVPRRTGAWTEAEDARLYALVKELGPNQWSAVAARMAVAEQIGGGRSGKSCRLRWHNQLDPSVNKLPFTEWEQAVIFKAQHDPSYENRWAAIARLLQQARTDNAVKNHFHATLHRKARAGLLVNRYLDEGVSLEWLLANPELRAPEEIAAGAASKRVMGTLRRTSSSPKRPRTSRAPASASAANGSPPPGNGASGCPTASTPVAPGRHSSSSSSCEDGPFLPSAGPTSAAAAGAAAAVGVAEEASVAAQYPSAGWARGSELQACGMDAWAAGDSASEAVVPAPLIPGVPSFGTPPPPAAVPLLSRQPTPFAAAPFQQLHPVLRSLTGSGGDCGAPSAAAAGLGGAWSCGLDSAATAVSFNGGSPAPMPCVVPVQAVAAPSSSPIGSPAAVAGTAFVPGSGDASPAGAATPPAGHPPLAAQSPAALGSSPAAAAGLTRASDGEQQARAKDQAAARIAALLQRREARARQLQALLCEQREQHKQHRALQEQQAALEALRWRLCMVQQARPNAVPIKVEDPPEPPMLLPLQPPRFDAALSVAPPSPRQPRTAQGPAHGLVCAGAPEVPAPPLPHGCAWDAAACMHDGGSMEPATLPDGAPPLLLPPQPAGHEDYSLLGPGLEVDMGAACDWMI